MTFIYDFRSNDIGTLQKIHITTIENYGRIFRVKLEISSMTSARCYSQISVKKIEISFIGKNGIGGKNVTINKDIHKSFVD